MIVNKYLLIYDKYLFWYNNQENCKLIDVSKGEVLLKDKWQGKRRKEAAGRNKVLYLTLMDYSFIVYLVIQSIGDVKVNG